jgi:hypothetical protein
MPLTRQAAPAIFSRGQTNLCSLPKFAAGERETNMPSIRAAHLGQFGDHAVHGFLADGG